MKKLAFIVLGLLFLTGLYGCGGGSQDPFPINTKSYRTDVKQDVDPVVLEELELAFDFFWETQNTNTAQAGYGLIPDRFHTNTNQIGTVASIASVGFGLTAIPIGVENGFITREEGEERAYQTLVSMSNLDRRHGFFFHFMDMQTGARVWESEVSIIDTALFINGALTAGRFFGGRTEKLSRELYEAIEWNWYYDASQSRFYMGYWPERGFEGHWGGYAEQLMLYVLAAGSPTFPVGKSAYNRMKLSSTLHSATPEYGAFYSTHTGSLFTHQYSHAWIDFAQYNDAQGFNWFTNSVHATEAAIAYAKTLTPLYEGINANSWGMSAADGPNGYKGNYGSGPSAGNAHFNDGTVPAYGAIGSIVFKPVEAIAAMKNYRTFPSYFSKYGFKDSYNLSVGVNGWFANDIIGIDKGISIVMLENYMSGMVWKIHMEIDYIQVGLENLGFTKVNT
ncbi:glucoamylase family protein [Paracholeplasma manati]|uniref:Glycoamylase-like domain-containing protein n=1 Tax=Paracholeplasma manati TaxID=591373 RepID=A0ABT2Y747_9MOLU|nr:glucoamylase family protein [Paracholeplasma manati]MCV2232564.1 hypothetical protein [Paracholeplasma manati]MDG0889057.1 glucoamylase family protein [Paracholeplasma manati]